MKKLFLFLTVLMIPLACSAADQSAPQMNMRGEATLFMPADQMEITIGVVTQNLDSGAAVQANNVKMKAVITALLQTGLHQEEYQTGSFNIQPNYAYHQNDAPTLKHYEVMNTIKIKTQKLDLAEKMIGAAAKSGANRVEQIIFNLKDPHAFKEQAIEQAAQNAIGDAKALARATQVQLVRILSLSLDQVQNHYPMPMAYAANKMAAGDASYDAPIEAGNVEVRATVNITFEIESIGTYSMRS